MDPKIPEIEEVPSLLLPCASCNRTFRPEALAKHTKVCEKSLMKKRKQFDSSKQRLQGTEIVNFATPVVAKTQRKKETPINPYKAKVKEKLDLGKTIQTMKKPIESSSVTQVKPSDHEECPYCGRSFGPKAFERHTEFCKEQHQKLKLTPNINNEAKERLKVRTSYRGPLTNRVLNRDRYQPARNRDSSPMTASCTELRDEETKSKSLTRNASLRSSFRGRTSETVPPPPLRRTMTQINPRLRSSKDSIDNEELSNKSGNSTRTSTANRPRLYSREPVEKKDTEMYNPYISAERQMMELFGGDDTTKAKSTLPEIPLSPPIQSSPASAFVKYSPHKGTPSLESLKSDNKENNNDIEHTPEPVSPGEKIDNRRNFSLSNLSLCSVVSIDSIDGNKNSACSKNINSSQLDEFQRSFSALESKSRSYGKTKVNMQQMLYGSQSPDQTVHSESSNNSDAGNIEACEQELLNSMLEFEKMLKSSPLPSLHSSPVLCSSSAADVKDTDIENKKNQRNLSNNIDSAYSSLTRSSGAEGDNNKQTELPKFCHECGSKYPVAMAKFCCNCGMRRIIL